MPAPDLWWSPEDVRQGSAGTRGARWGLPPKSLAGIPWRYALRCVDELGLILRAEVVWSKPNGLPESVTDRVRRSHEQWFHFAIQPRYYSAVDEIRQRYTGDRALSRRAKHPGRGKHAQRAAWNQPHTLGRIPGSVWEIATQPLRTPAELGVDHYAAFPMEWPRRIIRGWSPHEVCTACGQGRHPIVERTPMQWRESPSIDGRSSPGTTRRTASGTMVVPPGARIIGHACACPDATAPSTPGVVLDPFGGTGTTALVAAMLGRIGITVDASADYGRLAQWRCNDGKQRARASGLPPQSVSRVRPVPQGQESLFVLGGDGAWRIP